MARIVVVGGGISGLAAAHRLRCQRHEVLLVEAEARCGGHVHTEREDDFVVEAGPNAFLDRASEPETMALVRELELEAWIQPANRAARRRYVWRKGRLRPAPASPLSLLSTDALSLHGKLRVAAEPFVPRGRDRTETVHAFATRRLGREAADALVDPAISGISAGDSRELEAAAAFPGLVAMERDHGSLLRAMLARRERPARLLSLAGGMGTLAEALVLRLGDAFHVRARVLRVTRTALGWQVLLHSGERLDADAVLIATSAPRAAETLVSQDAELARQLHAFPQAGLAVVAMAFRTQDVPRRLDGYGYLAARGEGLATLGVVWESSLFPDRAPRGHVLLRAMLGGVRRPDLPEMDEPSLLLRARRDLAAVLKVEQAPVRHWVWRWPRAITQYTRGHLDRVARVHARLKRHPGLELCGTSYDGVSFTSAIVSAERAAARLLGTLASQPASPWSHPIRAVSPPGRGAPSHLSLVRPDPCVDTSS